jgi:hypothetical protein
MAMTPSEIGAERERLEERKYPVALCRAAKARDYDAIAAGLAEALPDLWARFSAEKPGVPMKDRIFVAKSGGENAVLVLDTDYVVKCADMAEPGTVAAETLLQGILAERVPDFVPGVVAVSDTRQVFAMEYRKGITVQDINQNAWSRDIKDETKSAALLADLRRFAGELGDAVSPSEALALGITERHRFGPDYRSLAPVFEEALDKAGLLDETAPPEARDIHRRFLELVRPSIRHEDLHNNNILVDPETGHVTAVIDFGVVGLAPRHRLEDSAEQGWNHIFRGGEAAARGPADSLLEAAVTAAEKYRDERRLPAGSWLPAVEASLCGDGPAAEGDALFEAPRPMLAHQMGRMLPRLRRAAARIGVKTPRPGKE